MSTAGYLCTVARCLFQPKKEPIQHNINMLTMTASRSMGRDRQRILQSIPTLARNIPQFAHRCQRRSAGLNTPLPPLFNTWNRSSLYSQPYFKL